MKKKMNVGGKLNLNKDSISRLNEEQMYAINGGLADAAFTSLWNCKTKSSITPETQAGNSSPCNPQTCGSPAATCLYLNGC